MCVCESVSLSVCVLMCVCVESGGGGGGDGGGGENSKPENATSWLFSDLLVTLILARFIGAEMFSLNLIKQNTHKS